MATQGEDKKLRLKYHGRILDHLGIQMYQSPVAAISELVANAWDADAENVRISLPDSLDGDAEIVIQDDGAGMTIGACQDRYLNVGWGRRGDNPEEQSPGGRPVLGRKGIGKFAGFGIAKVIRVETTSKGSGEETAFEMDIDKLRGDVYVEETSADIHAQYLPPDDARICQAGTSIRLKKLNLGRKINPDQFAKSMARRFTLQKNQANFKVFVNGFPIPDSLSLVGAEFVFPRDYEDKEKPASLKSIDSAGWGVEEVGSTSIRWRMVFFEDTIDEEELRGVSVFAKGKLCQAPFLFNLTGGLGGQAGVEYLAGQVEADYLDSMPLDVIAPERQRINWELDETVPLLEWGQGRVKKLLRIWHDRRGEERRKELEKKVAGFSERLEGLPTREAATVKTALRKIGGISSLSKMRYEEIGGAILTAWEQGRLRGLIEDISKSDTMTAEELLDLLAEAQVLAALNVAEAVRTKIDAIRGLRRLIAKKELENAVRNYIAKDPWLINPKWDTFRVEKSVRWILDKAANEVGFKKKEFKGRVDLALLSGEHLLVVEFVRPGKKVDWDHLSRCRRYVLRVRSLVKPESALGIKKVTGLVVADELDKDSDVTEEIQELQKSDIEAFTWKTLLGLAEKAWKGFLDILIERAPEDKRLESLKD